MQASVDEVENIIGYTFKDQNRLREALQASGSYGALSTTYPGRDRPFPDGHKRLAVIGDTVLQLSLSISWYSGVQNRGPISALAALF